MKKYSSLLLCAVVCLLTACGAKEGVPSAASVPSPDISVEVETPPAQPPEIILYTVGMNSSGETVYAEDGTVLLTSSFRYPTLSVHRGNGMIITEGETEKEAAALAAAEVFNGYFSSWGSNDRAEGDIMAADKELAMEDYAWRKSEGIAWNGSYAMELDCTAYQTRRMISVTGLSYSYTGGAHPNSVNMAWNFDLESGEFFGPELLGGTELQTAVAEELKRQSAERAKEFGAAPEEVYWADYEAILDDWQSSAVSFGPQGMTVAYSPYELAAYAFGAQVYEISYEFLRPYLSLQGLELLGLAEEPGA
ncbi:MAG: DUF3298 domain-containing protein [Oscillibacter sp.]|nr:DUF3298 domain-containing protein [Oscillibacter sp.]